jgi:hypothetical protein
MIAERIPGSELTQEEIPQSLIANNQDYFNMLFILLSKASPCKILINPIHF